MRELAGQTGLFPPEPAPDPLLCWLWLAHVLGPACTSTVRIPMTDRVESLNAGIAGSILLWHFREESL